MQTELAEQVLLTTDLLYHILTFTDYEKGWIKAKNFTVDKILKIRDKRLFNAIISGNDITDDSIFNNSKCNIVMYNYLYNKLPGRVNIKQKWDKYNMIRSREVLEEESLWALNNNIDLFNEMILYRPSVYYSKCMSSIITKADLRSFKLLYDRNTFNRSHVDKIVAYDLYEFVKYIHEDSGLFDDLMITRACEYSRLGIVRYLYTNGAKCDSDMIDLAIKFNNQEIVQYLYNNGESTDYYGLICAIKSNNYWAIRFLIEHEIQWDWDIFNKHNLLDYSELTEDYLIVDYRIISYLYSINTDHHDIVLELLTRSNDKITLDNTIWGFDYPRLTLFKKIVDDQGSDIITDSILYNIVITENYGMLKYLYDLDKDIITKNIEYPDLGQDHVINDSRIRDILIDCGYTKESY